MAIYLPRGGSSAGSSSEPLGTFQTKTTNIHITDTVASGVVISTSSPDPLFYTVSGNTPNLEMVSTTFNNKESIRLYLNGVMLTKGEDVFWSSPTAFYLSKEVDYQDDVIIIC